MTTLKTFVLTVLFSLTALVFGKEAEQIYGQCIKVADGDTITVLDAEGQKYKVRFYGIDAPEKDQDWGQKSKAVLTEAIDQKHVRLEVLNTDRYSRKVSKVYLIDDEGGELYVNIYMVQTGNAWYYEQYAKGDVDLATAQKIAQDEKRGLWSTKNPVAPWNYRSGFNKTTTSTTAHKFGAEWFWVSSTGKVHNSSCTKYFGQGKGEMTMQPKGENCKVCGGCTEK